jgi:hypothetical protein
MLYFLPVILGLSGSALSTKLPLKKPSRELGKFVMVVFWIVNGALLLVVLFHPSDKDTELYRAIYRARPERLLYTTNNPYLRAGFNLKYYQPPGLIVEKWNEAEPEKNEGRRTLIVSEKFTSDIPPNKVLYRSAPAWVKRFNFNHWLERTKLWVLYQN